MDNKTEQTKDLYDRFFDDLGNAVRSGVFTLPYVGEANDGEFSFDTNKALSAVLRVIKKYSANPHEPIQTTPNEGN